MERPDLELVYLGDPMCSWCWGFSPVLAALHERFDMPLRVVVGGLAPGMDQPVDDQMAAMLAHHWHQVHEASGQPFDHAILARRGWQYDTELPCIAVVTVRTQAPESTRAFFARLHRAFYAEGVDITAPAAYPALVDGFVPDVGVFMDALVSKDMKNAAWTDFAFARQMGINGFPTLLLRDGSSWVLATRGFAPLESLEPALQRWLGERFGPETAEGLYCPVDGVC